MIFDVLKSTVTFSQYGPTGRRGIKFEVVPQGREQLDIGEKYILAAQGHARLRGQGRELVSASVSISSDPKDVEWVKGERPICGVARFFGPRTNKFEAGEPPTLAIHVTVEPEVFDRMAEVQIKGPGAATLHTKIEGLEFGWEPDGSHQTWDLSDESDCEDGSRRRVTSFWFNADTFTTTEQAMSDAEERRLNEWLAGSPNPEDRKLAELSQRQQKPDAVVSLLQQCRWLLIALLILGGLLFLRRG